MSAKGLPREPDSDDPEYLKPDKNQETTNTKSKRNTGSETKEEFRREKGYLYYIGKDGFVWATPMKHNKSGRKKRVGTVKHPKVKEFKDLITDEGFVSKARRKTT
jgi:hypothetical protein